MLGEKIMIEKNIRKVTWSKIVKNKSKDSDNNFLVMFFFSKALRTIEKREEIAHWCWPQFVMTHETRTTRTPAASWLLILLSHNGTQVKRRQSKSYKFKEFLKISNIWILKRALHATHLPKLLDYMCKYEMDLMSIVEDTERTRFCPRTDGRTDRRTRWNQYTPLSTSLKRGV